MRIPLSRPAITPYLEPPAVATGSGLRATFLGTSSVLVRDDRTALLVDGYFTRPSKIRLLATKVAPDPEIVATGLARAGIEALDAVFCAHSHVDHALDAPVIARRFGAPLVGSASTAQIGRGYGLPEDLLCVAADGESFTFGDFTVTLVTGVHSPGDRVPGVVTEPFTPPARANAWKTGESYSIFFAHPGGTVLVHASANYVPGKLAGRRADVVYLGIGELGRQSEEFREAYWHELVETTGARTVLPVHWDDFTLPLDRPLRTMPYPMDDFAVSMDFLTARCRDAGIRLVLPRAWEERRIGG